MQDISKRLEVLVSETAPRLRALPEAETERRPAPGKWSKKEVLGHLIDSAANNHQRFVRAQLENPLAFPAYAQESWVGAQAYQKAPWEGLIQLWASYNRHLAHVIASTPGDRLSHARSIGNSQPVTHEFLIRDYVRHLEHHLRQIFGA